ncbi:MAG: hypothetical protein H7Z37_10435 [Pyrinomonadaceae bacterium]|nr:hypothetical protein [Pyrinomonadaceae bacterium]
MQSVKEIGLSSRSATNLSPFVIVVALFFMTCAAFVIGAFPLTLSIVTIFLFAGVHNFVEFRYFLARMPLRWGNSRTYYSIGIGGVFTLTIIYLSIYFASNNFLYGATNYMIFVGVWNTLFLLWLASLLWLRGRQKPRSDYSFAFPVALFVASFAWFLPQYFALSLVYLHPFVALYFFERQLRRTRPEYVKTFHVCLATLPVFLVILWLILGNSPNIATGDFLSWRITQHAGGEILPFVSNKLLVATHVFLETIHYTIWILLMPLIDKKAVPFRLKNIPLFVHKQGFPRIITAVLLLGIVAIVALWFGFAIDYATTRDVYFALAISHVLAEMPFLIKML